MAGVEGERDQDEMDESEDEDEGEEKKKKPRKVTEFKPTFLDNILSFKHSFGYDCKRFFNLVLIDDDTLVFASGNFLHYFSISERKVTFRKSVFSAGFGFITKNEHPDFVGLLTVAENGPNPTIFIYEYPSHSVHVRLEGAAKTCFTCGSYNSSGELFASQAGYPDFMLTIWRWQTAEVVLRSKSFQNDILHVHFSNFNPILLASCGLSHIKFWKMANTFTGLKLKGDLGRFGKTDFSDIYAIYMLPDENVISGCEWGNMLLWEAGLIKFEICRKGRKPCHTKPITRISMDNGEVTTVGMDGYVRIWFWETVDLADPPDEDRFVEIEPIYEFKVGDCEIRGLQKIKPFDETDFGYYAQDGNGGIWYCDLNTRDVPNEPEKLYTCHGGRVIAAQTSPASAHLMTIGEDGKIFIYNYLTKRLLLEKRFLSVGTDLLWFNTKVSSTGMDLVAGFEDGILRQLVLDIQDENNTKLHLVRAIKGHVSAITRLAVNPKNTILVTGSADKSIFIYNIKNKANNMVKLQAMGFIQLNAVVYSINWRNEEISTILIGCKTGEVYECQLPARVTDEQVFLSYNITNVSSLKSTSFVSVKSRIRRDIKRINIKIRKDEKRQRKLVEVEKLKAANPGLQIDMETALADSEPEEEEEPLHIPSVPNPVLWLRYTPTDRVWVSMGGYDAGYIYELRFGAPEPVRCTLIADGDDCEIHSYIPIQEFLIFGLVNGKLRINRTNPDDFTDLRDNRLVSMHDTRNGVIPRLLFSHDGAYMFSIGHDGNVFLYEWKGPIVARESPIDNPIYPVLDDLPYVDIDDPTHPSLEQEKINAEIARQQEAAQAHDLKVLGQIGKLQVKFNEIRAANENLPSELKILDRDLLLDQRITKQIRSELQAELDDVRDDLAYDLEVEEVGKKKLYNHFLKKLDHVPFTISAVRTATKVDSFRVEGLGEDYDKIREEIEERLRLEAAKRGQVEPAMAEEKEPSMPEPGTENFFFGRDPNMIIPRFSKKMLRLLRRYRSRQLYEVERIFNWEQMERKKPDPNTNHPDDDRKILDAERSLGDYKLKIGADYEPRLTENLTYKCIELANARQSLFGLMDRFNKELSLLRKRKWDLYQYIGRYRARLAVLHRFLPEQNRSFLRETSKINMNEEYPEHNLKEHYTPGCGIEIEDILYLEKKVDDFLPKPPSQDLKTAATSKERDEIEIYNALQVMDVEFLPSVDEVLEEVNKLPKITDQSYLEKDENTQISPWLTEARYRWLIELADEQNGIIMRVDNRIEKFDKDLAAMVSRRYQTRFEAEFMSCYMISLHQELNILRDSEEIENQLLYNADDAMKTRNQVQVLINSKNRQVEEYRKNVDKLNDQIVTVQQKFMSTCKGHKFFDFLRRIFKKKWRAPKPPKADDESSESSSSDESSSEDENADAKSIDSLDMTTIRLDESHCPSGLERPMYELAFKLRAERHALEKSLVETQKNIDSWRLEIAELQRKMRHHEEIYAQEWETLLIFRRKRQQELNKIKISVVLNMDQMQHFRQNEDYRDLSKAILFDAQRLSSLKDRVQQLNDEMQETRRLHRINIVHLRRMNTDIKFMRGQIMRLEAQIKQEMMKKFGMVINLDELEEEVLRRHVFELETSAEEELKAIEKELMAKMLELAQLEEELIQETNTNTEKQNVLMVLNEEKNFLDEVLYLQDRNYEKWIHPQGVNLDRDVEKLTQISKQQKGHIMALEREICTLRLKSKPLQLFDEVVEQSTVDKIIEPPDDPFACPRSLAPDAYLQRREPDQFIMDRVKRIVQKYFAQWIGAYAKSDQVRKYAKKAARYLGQAANTFEGRITERIMEFITQSLEMMIPKKYVIYIQYEGLNKMFKEILALFDYEHSETDTEELVTSIYQNAIEALHREKALLNKTQFVILNIFKQLIEVLPLEEFVSETTYQTLVNLLDDDPVIDPKCINLEGLVEKTVNHARENLLDTITAVPIRRLAENILRILVQNKPGALTIKCTLGSVERISVSRRHTLF